MGKFMQPVSGTKMIELKKDIAELKRRIKKCNDDGELRKLKRTLAEKQVYYNVLADRLKTR